RKGLRRQMLRRPTTQSNGSCYGSPSDWRPGALRLTDDTPRHSCRRHSVVSGDAPERRRPADAVLSKPAGAIAARVHTGNPRAAWVCHWRAGLAPQPRMVVVARGRVPAGIEGRLGDFVRRGRLLKILVGALVDEGVLPLARLAQRCGRHGPP